ncbi:hypothetical protein ACF1GT_17675 [Streptomyces sp. NPDC014636]|uniref:hypothetical protein n=1 Tax=Streptomyces sp. NPDC014636 TaxID=3364876 RepID=UPI0037028B8C
MTRISKKQRFAMLTATATLAAGGALLPSGAFAAPAAPHTQVVAAAEASNHQHADQNKVTTITKTSTRTNTRQLADGRLKITITKTTTTIKIKNGDVVSKKVVTVKRQKIVDLDFQDNDNNHNGGDMNDR